MSNSAPDIPEHLVEDDEDVEFGDRSDAVIDTDEAERHWYKVDGKVYWFDIGEVSWEKKTDILDRNLETDSRTGEIDLNLKGFYRDMMEEVIVDSSIDGGLATFLKGMKPELGDKLQDDVPQPGTVMDEAEEGN